jgi:hypothetical protein
MAGVLLLSLTQVPAGLRTAPWPGPLLELDYAVRCVLREDSQCYQPRRRQNCDNNWPMGLCGCCNVAIKPQIR